MSENGGSELDLGDALRAALQPSGLSRFASQAKPAAAIAKEEGK